MTQQKPPTDAPRPLVAGTVPPAPPRDDSTLPPDADFDDRFMDFWKRNGVSIFTGIALAALFVIGYQIYQFVSDRREASIRAEFAAVESQAERIAFTQKFPKHPLAGLAFLEIANQKYDAGDWTQAASYFQAAVDALGSNPAAQRAQLGAAMTQLKAGQRDQARQSLEILALSPSAFATTRAEAVYNLAVLAWEEGLKDDVRRHIATIEGMEESGFWIFRAAELRERLGDL